VDEFHKNNSRLFNRWRFCKASFIPSLYHSKNFYGNCGQPPNTFEDLSKTYSCAKVYKLRVKRLATNPPEAGADNCSYSFNS